MVICVSLRVKKMNDLKAPAASRFMDYPSSVTVNAPESL